MHFEGHFALIPSFVLDSDLSDSELRLYAKISQLCNKLGFCYAKNAYLAEITHKSIPTINRILAKLAKKELIKIEIKNGRDRKIYLNLDFKYFCDKENAITNEQKQPVKAKTEPKEYKDTTEQEKQLKTQDLVLKTTQKTEKSEAKAETSKSENFNSLEKIKLPAFLDFEIWKRFIKYRKEINKPVREMEAVNLFAIWKEWDKDDISVNECILQAMANNWKIVYRLDNAKKRTADLTADEIMKTQDLSFNPNFATESEKALFRFLQEQEQLKLENKEENYAITTRQINSD